MNVLEIIYTFLLPFFLGIMRCENTLCLEKDINPRSLDT